MPNHLSYTLADLKAAVRIIDTRARMKDENYFPAEHFEPCDADGLNPIHHRLADGSGTDPKRRTMGSRGRLFARNVPPEGYDDQPAWQPDPRVVSQRLLHQAGPGQELAPSLNLLAVGWIQFQVHDWFDHAKATDQLGQCATDAQDAVHLDATEAVDLDDRMAYRNTQGHWWDGSQIYGGTQAITDALRVQEAGLRRAELALTDDDRLPLGQPLRDHESDRAEVELTGFVKNWWIGLSVLHTMFAREHNLIVAELRGQQDQGPTESTQAYEDRVFNTARLVNSAVMAKIHTVEWTPILINIPALQLAMFADWWGVGQAHASDVLGKLKGLPLPDETPINDALITLFEEKEVIDAELARVLRQIIVEGQPPNRQLGLHIEVGNDGSPIDYAMTEEFVSVYRMHALLRDEIRLRGVMSSELHSLRDVSFEGARDAADEFGIDRLIYSLAKESAGALRLNNYPPGLTRIELPDQIAPVDLGAIDLMRDRERGVPRYAAFKRWISKYSGPLLSDGPTEPIRSFQQICGDPTDPRISAAERARRLRDAELLSCTYGSVDEVDLLVGMLAEPLPDGFAFSWTAFEIFMLMAVFRISLDRFYTEDFRPEVYTEAGLQWVQDRTMNAILAQHYPELAPLLRSGENPFLIESWRDWSVS